MACQETKFCKKDDSGRNQVQNNGIQLLLCCWFCINVKRKLDSKTTVFKPSAAALNTTKRNPYHGAVHGQEGKGYIASITFITSLIQ
jgi:hypothetical protein